METQNPNFLQRLQAADDRTKKKIIIVAAIVLMIIVVVVWLVYFNPVLPSAASGS